MTPRTLAAAALTGVALLLSSVLPVAAAGKSYDPEKDPLVIGLSAALVTLDPIRATSHRTEGNVLSHVYSTLARVAPDGTLQGDAAEKWEQVAPKEWLFTLKPGIRFTNGDPLDAQAVAEVFTRAMDKEKSIIRNRIPSFASVEVKSPTELLFRTATIDFQFPYRTEEVYLTSTAWLAGNNPAAGAVGSGPYKLVSYDPQGVIRLERNEDYYGEKPEFREVEFRVIPTEAGRIAALRAGEADLVTALDPISIPQLAADPDLRVGAVPGFRTHFLQFDTLQPPFDNVDVRRALNYAVNKEEIAATVLQGLATPASQLLAPGMPGHDPALKPYPYDPAKAKELLAKAGFPDGFETEILNSPGAYAGDDLMVQAIAQQLADVGVKAKIRNLPYTAYLDEILNLEKRPAPIFFKSLGYRFAANNTLRVQQFGSGYRGSTYSNPDYDAARDAGFAGQTVEEQEAAFRRLNDIVHDQVPLLFLFDEPQTYAVNKGIDWTPRPENWLRAFDVHVAKPAGQ